MPHTVAQLDRRYIAALSVVSLLILVAGVWFRPSRTPPPVPSELETLNVQLARQRLDLERRSLFYSRKAEELMKVSADVRSHPETLPFQMKPPGEMVLLVATGSNGELVWASSQTAGATEVECGDIVAKEVTTTSVIPTTLSNAVAFDFDNNLAGLVISCGDRRVLVTPESYRHFAAERAVETTLRSCCGVHVTRKLEVAAVDPDSELAKAGLRSGDSFVAVGNQPVASRRELHAGLSASPAATEVTIQRGPRTRKLTIRRAEAAR